MNDDKFGNQMRLFLAMTPPLALRQTMELQCRLLQSHLPRLRWTAADHYHLTLRFLGQTPENRVAEIIQVMTEEAAVSPPMALQLQGWGGFPHHQQARVLWVGVTGEGMVAMQHLTAALTRRLAPQDNKPFIFHLTVARAPAAAIRLPEGWQDIIPLPRLDWLAQEVVLYQSVLTPQGSLYRRLATASFKAGKVDEKENLP